MNQKQYLLGKAFILFVAVALLALAGAARQANSSPKTIQVSIHEYQFTPATVTVHPGDTVEWKNDDDVDHTATATGAGKPAFDSGPIAHGQVFRYVAGANGSYDYMCTIHPTMKGSLIVK